MTERAGADRDLPEGGSDQPSASQPSTSEPPASLAPISGQPASTPPVSAQPGSNWPVPNWPTSGASPSSPPAWGTGGVPASGPPVSPGVNDWSALRRPPAAVPPPFQARWSGPPYPVHPARTLSPAAARGIGGWSSMPAPLFSPRRPRYREAHPIRAGAVWAGIGAGFLWFLMFGLVSWSLLSYLWSTVIAGVLAGAAAVVLVRYGDRGVAVGVAAISAAAVGIIGLIVAIADITGRWLLW